MPMGPRIAEGELLSRVQQRIDDGRVPVAIPASINAGYGNVKQQCRICDEHIMPHQVMYEVKDPRGPGALSFHFTCYTTWQRECAQRLDGPRRSDQHAQMDRKMLTEHLLLADRHCVEAQEIVMRQRALVEKMRRDGHDTQQAEALLKEFERTLASHVADRERIRAELARSDD